MRGRNEGVLNGEIILLNFTTVCKLTKFFCLLHNYYSFLHQAEN